MKIDWVNLINDLVVAIDDTQEGDYWEDHLAPVLAHYFEQFEKEVRGDERLAMEIETFGKTLDFKTESGGVCRFPGCEEPSASFNHKNCEDGVFMCGCARKRNILECHGFVEKKELS